jgi:hypothetical protein
MLQRYIAQKLVAQNSDDGTHEDESSPSDQRELRRVWLDDWSNDANVFSQSLDSKTAVDDDAKDSGGDDSGSPDEYDEEALEPSTSSSAEIEDARLQRLLTNVPEMQLFLTNNSAWQWLEHRLETSTRCCHWSRNFLDRILRTFAEFPDRRPEGQPQQYRVQFRVHWDPRAFLHRYFPASNQHVLENVLTISGRNGQVYTATCADCLHEMWSAVGTRFVLAL